MATPCSACLPPVTPPDCPRDKYNVLVGVTGSVAAIKIPELSEKLLSCPIVSELAIVPTENALNFFEIENINQIGAKFPSKALKIWRDADEWSMWKGRGDPVLHIDLGKWADVVSFCFT